MAKMKTNSGAKKRFDFTGSGKIKRQKAYHSHILTSKSAKTKRALVQNSTVDKTDEYRIKRLLCKA